jgi:TPR repeat protein
MFNLANYYYKIKNFKEMEKYYLMAIKHGHTNAMNNLGLYYENIEKNFKEMEKYYLIEINNGVDKEIKLQSLINLGNYYKKNLEVI